MDTSLPAPTRALMIRLGALAFALVLLMAPASALADTASGSDGGDTLVLAAEERERRPIAPTQRSQFALVLYVLMGVGVVVAGATMRRQLKGQRPQTDGEFRWR